GRFHEIRSPTWVAVDKSGDIAAPAKPLGKEGDFVENLEGIARHRQALGLRNPDPDSWLTDRVTMEFRRILPDGTLATAEPERAGGTVVFEEGEIFELSIRNEDSEPVYLNLLSFDAGGRIKVLYPPRGSNEALAPGAQLKLRPPRGKPFVPRIEAGFPEQPFPFGAAGDDAETIPLQALETFKLFVTTEPADFSFLEQERLRGGAGSPLELLMATATGHVTRGSEMVMPEAVSDWTTIERSFLVRADRALDPEGGEVDLGSARISSSGLEGAVRVHGWESRRGEEEQLRGPALADALAATGVETRQTIELADTRPVAGSGTRSVTPAGEPAMELELRGPGTDFGQMVLATNEGGLLSWHFPEPADEAATRGEPRTRSAGPPRHRFTLSASVEESPEEPKRRSLVGAIGKKLIQELVFPLVDPAIGKVGDYFVGKFEEKKRPYRLRTYTPEDYLSNEAAEIEGPTWEHLASGRSLLLLHGAFSQSHTGFASMPAGFIEELHRRYEGRV
ncbi:MAG: hypothetical protein R3266_15885, partial [Gemmatimonadota bacterium]|nr:hypothetical protein [Gemmatimonadota bacterium]